MKKIFNTRCSGLTVTVILLFPTPVLAYLDPGSGSILLYFLIGIFATLIYSIKNLYFKVKARLYWIFSKNIVNLNDKKNIVFYSEGGRYWETFRPVIMHLSKMGIRCSYYTSDKNDLGLDFQAPNVDSLFIGSGNFSLMSLNFLKAKILVMTTPQLDVMHLKRSSRVDYFVHLVHSPVDILINYRPYGFDFFDCVMCSGQHQINSLRLIERARGTAAKKILKTGLVYFDRLVENKDISIMLNGTVLIAPTWGPNSILNRTGVKSLQLLLNSGFEIILRPHPQSFISDPELMQEIECYCNKHKSIKIDKNPSAQESMQRASILVSDISGIIFDFSFIYERPVIAFSNSYFDDTPTEISEIRSTIDVEYKVWELEVMHEVATEVDINRVNDLPVLVNQALKANCAKSIESLRESSMFNYGCSGKVAANQIKEILSKLC